MIHLERDCSSEYEYDFQTHEHESRYVQNLNVWPPVPVVRWYQDSKNNYFLQYTTLHGIRLTYTNNNTLSHLLLITYVTYSIYKHDKAVKKTFGGDLYKTLYSR